MPARRPSSRRGKTATKSAKAKLPKLVPRPDGKGALLTGGVPGNAGGGRPPKAFTSFLAELREDPEVQEEFTQAAKDRTSPSYRAALSIMAQYDPERPAERKTVRLEGERGVAAAFEIVHARIRAKLDAETARDLIADIQQELLRLP